MGTLNVLDICRTTEWFVQSDFWLGYRSLIESGVFFHDDSRLFDKCFTLAIPIFPYEYKAYIKTSSTRTPSARTVPVNSPRSTSTMSANSTEPSLEADILGARIGYYQVAVSFLLWGKSSFVD